MKFTALKSDVNIMLKRFVEFTDTFNLLPNFRFTDNPEHRAKRDLHDEYHAEQIKRIWKVQVDMVYVKFGKN